MGSGYYKLDPVTKKITEVATIRDTDWNATNRRVAYDDINGVQISTVFLPLDHSFGEGPPLVFETLVFGGKHDQDMWRYSTWEEAEQGHKAAVELVTSSVGPPQLDLD